MSAEGGGAHTLQGRQPAPRETQARVKGLASIPAQLPAAWHVAQLSTEVWELLVQVPNAAHIECSGRRSSAAKRCKVHVGFLVQIRLNSSYSVFLVWFGRTGALFSAKRMIN